MYMYTEVIDYQDDFTRKVYRFYWIERVGVVLENYVPQTRVTKRHKWKADRRDCWVRLDRRDNEIPKPEVPGYIKYLALTQLRDKIQYCEDPNA